MQSARNFLMMTTAAALCVAPMLAFGQANTGGSSQQPTTTQSPSPSASAPGAANPRDGTPGNPPSTATQRAIDSVTGNRTDADGRGNNPPGTAAGRAIDRATDGATRDTAREGVAPGAAGNPGQAATSGGTVTGASRDNATTGATSTTMPVDSARTQGGRRASKVIGANVYNENNESIGEVDDIIIPPGGGQPVAILSVGGFLGIGARLVAVPYEQLRHAGDRDRWVLPGVTKESLQNMPEFRHEDDRRRG